MKNIMIAVLCLGLLFMSLQPLVAQEEKEETPNKPPPKVLEKGEQIYHAEDRRDPFRDLLAGKEVEEKAGQEGVSSYMIEDIVLIGIVKIKGKYVAIINGPQGFPYNITPGEKFANGFVVSIDDSKVVFRQTKDRGVPLTRPRDITKEINPEEQ
jgi:Tfp pilus assembly protein PilP